MYNIFLMLLIGLCLHGNFALWAQDQITLEEVINITLDNNFDIKIANQTVDIAHNATDKKLNNYIPSVQLTAGAQSNITSSRQVFSNGNENVVNNALQTGVSAGVSSNYQIYNAQREARMEVLRAQLKGADLSLRNTVEQSLFQVQNTYWNIARLQSQRALVNESIQLSQQRLDYIELQLEYGQGNSLDALNTQVDIQRDSVSFLNLEQNIRVQKRQLNTLMGGYDDINYDVDTQLNINSTLSYASLLEDAIQYNKTLAVLDQNIFIRQQEMELIKSEARPTASLAAAYNYNRTDNPDGAFIDINRSNGLGLSLNVAMPLYDPTRSARMQAAKLNLESDQLSIDRQRLIITQQIQDSWDRYQNALHVMEVENKAVQASQEAYRRALDRYKKGQLTSIDLRQTQLNLLSAQTNYITARYDAKFLELELLRFSGRLLP